MIETQHRKKFWKHRYSSGGDDFLHICVWALFYSGPLAGPCKFFVHPCKRWFCRLKIPKTCFSNTFWKRRYFPAYRRILDFIFYKHITSPPASPLTNDFLLWHFAKKVDPWSGGKRGAEAPFFLPRNHLEIWSAWKQCAEAMLACSKGHQISKIPNDAH